MKKKLMTLALALGLSLAVLTGCSKPTVESLVDGMYDDLESQTVEMEMDIDCTISAMGFSFDAKLGGDFEAQVSGLDGKDAQMSYANGTMSLEVKAAGFDEEVEFEGYSIVDDGTVTSYSRTGDDDTWYVSESDNDSVDQDVTDKIQEAMKDVLKENGELAKDTEKVEGEECYVITATIEGSDWSDILKPMQGMIDDAMEDADVDIDVLSWFEYWSADLTYYISKDTGYLVKLEMDMSDSDIYGMVGQVVKDTGLDALMDGDYEDVVEGVSFSTFYISGVFSDVNDTEVKVPRDVINNAVDMDSSDAFGDLMGDIGDDPVIGDDPYADDPFADDPFADDPSVDDTDEWYHGDSFTFHKNYETDDFLCEVKIPDGWTYDDVYSDPEDGLVSLDTDDGNGYIWVQNYLEYPLYNALINDGKLPEDIAEYYENYNMDITVIGTAFGGSDVMLVEQSYESDGYVYEETFLCIEYDDGGYKEYLSIDCGSLRDLEDWTEDDLLDLARDFFGR